MSRFKDRSNYYKLIAENDIFIAHNAAITGTDKTRKSFHRINDEEELNASCSNWAHFPCIVHLDYTIGFNHPETGLPKPIVETHLYFLEKLNLDLYKTKAEAIEQAYDSAYLAMERFISWLLEDMEVNGICGNNLFIFNLKGAQARQVGPINDTLYGWYLIFKDTQRQSFSFDASKWKRLPDGEAGTGGGNNGGGSGETIYNYNGYNYNPATGLLTFLLPSGVTQDTLNGRLLEVVFFDAENPQFGYVNAEGNSFSTSPSTTNTISVQYFTPGVVGIKWRIISGAPSYAPITEYTTIPLTVNRISSRYFKLCIEDSLVGVQQGQFPITPLNVNGVELAEVDNIDEYITVMNADAANQAAFTINSYRQFPANGAAQYYELLLEPTAPYQAWQFNRKLEVII